MEEMERQQGEATAGGEPAGQGDGESTQHPDPRLQEVQRRWLESHRRALLAENAGRVVPELVVGESIDALEASLEVARGAFEAARAAALAEIAATPVPAGNPVRQGPNVESMSPMEKIAYGLRRE